MSIENPSPGSPPESAESAESSEGEPMTINIDGLDAAAMHEVVRQDLVTANTGKEEGRKMLDNFAAGKMSPATGLTQPGVRESYDRDAAISKDRKQIMDALTKAEIIGIDHDSDMSMGSEAMNKTDRTVSLSDTQWQFLEDNLAYETGELKADDAPDHVNTHTTRQPLDVGVGRIMIEKKSYDRSLANSWEIGDAHEPFDPNKPDHVKWLGKQKVESTLIAVRARRAA